AGETLVAVAYARLPLAVTTGTLVNASLDGDTYLALRQGSHTLAERGNAGLAGSAEFLSTKIEGTELRVAAALPEETAGVFGLDPMASFIAAGVLLLLAIGAVVLWKRRPGEDAAEAAPEEPTLA